MFSPKNIGFKIGTRPAAENKVAADALKKVPPGEEFVFRLRNGKEVARAASVKEFADKLKTVSAESLEFHTEGKHFGPWLRGLRFGMLADSVDNLKSKGEKLRHDLINLFNMVL